MLTTLILHVIDYAWEAFVVLANHVLSLLMIAILQVAAMLHVQLLLAVV
jgi:hypothetical protein